VQIQVGQMSSVVDVAPNTLAMIVLFSTAS